LIEIYCRGRLSELDEREATPLGCTTAARSIVFDMIGRYRAAGDRAAAADLTLDVVQGSAPEAMAAHARLLDLRALDEAADFAISEALDSLPKAERRILILAYLGFPFYDIATLPLLQGEGLDEFDPVKVDRISPDDATAIRSGGAAATLKGIQFNSFGAFFSRAYRENDYLWGRLHGAERLIDIIASTLPDQKAMPEATIGEMKRESFGQSWRRSVPAFRTSRPCSRSSTAKSADAAPRLARRFGEVRPQAVGRSGCSS
jgi:hypothetical protein